MCVIGRGITEFLQAPDDRRFEATVALGLHLISDRLDKETLPQALGGRCAMKRDPPFHQLRPWQCREFVDLALELYLVMDWPMIKLPRRDTRLQRCPGTG